MCFDDPGTVDVNGARTFGKLKPFDKRALTAKAKAQLRKKPAVRSGKAASKKPASMIHTTSGQHQQAVLPLNKRITKKGAPGPPESKDMKCYRS